MRVVTWNTYLAPFMPDREERLPRVLRTLSQPEPGDLVYYSSANISTCDASEKLSQDEVLDTVESSV